MSGVTSITNVVPALGGASSDVALAATGVAVGGLVATGVALFAIGVAFHIMKKLRKQSPAQ